MLMQLAQDPGGRATQSNRGAGLLEQVHLTKLWELVKDLWKIGAFAFTGGTHMAVHQTTWKDRWE